MEETINVLELFAGVGGLASQWLKGWRTVCYVEWAKYPQEIIKARIRDGLLDDAPIWDDAATFDGRPWRGFINVIKAGFPCQPFSVAGQGLAGSDPRDGWPHTIRIIREVQPRWVYLENVSGLLAGSHGYFGRILRELAESGYDAKWRVLSAAELGAPHKRDRVWIVAHAVSERYRESGAGKRPYNQKRNDTTYQQEREAIIDAVGKGSENVADANGERKQQPEGIVSKERGRPGDGRKDVANATGGRREQIRSSQETSGQQGSAPGRFTNGRDDVPKPESIGLQGYWSAREQISDSRQQERESEGRYQNIRGGEEWWSVEPQLGRVANGVANRVDRLKAIGNGEVPAVAAEAWDLLND